MARASLSTSAARLFDVCVPLAAATMLTAITSAHAQEPFYQGKTITLITSTGAGGSYDSAARAISRHMPKHLPGSPTIVVKNMPGAGHMRATNFMYNQADRDGTTMATVVNSIAMHQAVGGKGVMYDAGKFGWVGSIGISNLTFFVNAKAGVDDIKDAMSKEITLGATGVGSGTYIYPYALNQLVGTKFKIVTGYKSTPEIDLAIDRGEVQGRAGGSYSGVLQEHADWVKDGKIKFLAQVGLEPEPALEKTPLIYELAKNDEQRRLLRFISSPVKVGRPYLTPPGVPAERLALLRKAFDETMKDSEFVDEAKKIGLDLAPSSGAQIEEVVKETLDISPELARKAKAAMEPQSPGKSD